MTDRHGTFQMRSESPASRWYGETVYRISSAVALLCLLGSFVAILKPERNILDARAAFEAIWEGAGPAEIWGMGQEKAPTPRTLLRAGRGGDALIYEALVLGCLAAPLAALLCVGIYLNPRRRETRWAALSLAYALLVVLAAALGIYL